MQGGNTTDAVDAKSLLKAANEAIEARRFAEARRICEEGAVRHPSFLDGDRDPAFLKQLLHCLLLARLFDDARSLIAQVSEPGEAPLVWVDAVSATDTRFMSGEERAAAWRRVLAARPDNLAAERGLAHALLTARDLGKARAPIREAGARVAAQPNSAIRARVLADIGEALHLLGDLEQGEWRLSEAECAGLGARSLLGLAALRLDQKRRSEAARSLSAASRAHSTIRACAFSSIMRTPIGPSRRQRIAIWKFSSSRTPRPSSWTTRT